MTKIFIEAEEVHKLMVNDACRIIDASWHLPIPNKVNRNGYEEYQKQHIPKALFFDLDLWSAKSKLPHSLTTKERFWELLKKFNINKQTKVVIYDSIGLFSVARLYWTFKVYGLDGVRILKGGLTSYAEKYPLTDEIKEVEFSSDYNLSDFTNPNNYHITKAALTALLLQDYYNVLDMRPSKRFLGQVAEPRSDVSSGSIPGSLNFPFTELLNDKMSYFLDERIIINKFKDKGISLNKPCVTLCGSGVTASIMNLFFDKIGKKDYALYDGSWSDWGMIRGKTEVSMDFDS